ncbi:MAG: hypothetical protein HY355_05760 [Armatimonadetes bacterium]|nr:hypothetical protein [Armatimonadota bacterium]
MKRIARDEIPVLRFTQYGVAFHFICVTPAKGAPRPQDPTEIASFERDLLSYVYTQPPLLETHVLKHLPRNYNERLLETRIQFDSPLVFQSEDQLITLQPPRGAPRVRHRLVQVRVAETRFPQSHLSVFHLVLCPRHGLEESGLSEYDVVKLAKLWVGKSDPEVFQEPYTIENQVRFAPAGDDWMTISELAEAVSGVTPLAARVGTIQLLEAEGFDWDALVPLISRLKKELAGETPASDEREDRRPSPELQAVAGILQCLLDFARVGDVYELRDVFGPAHLVEDELITIHKGALISIASEDRAYQASSEYVGISPYLLIPHAVLLHNHEQLSRAQEAWDEVEAYGGPERSPRWHLDRARVVMGRALDRDYLPNVFHYPGEQELYITGEQSRGLAGLKQVLRDRLSAIVGELEARRDHRRWMADVGTNLLLGVLSVITGLQLANMVMAPETARRIAAGGILLAAALYLTWRIRAARRQSQVGGRGPS